MPSSDIVWGHLNRSAVIRVGGPGEQPPAI
jgi:hypothetical protein